MEKPKGVRRALALARRLRPPPLRERRPLARPAPPAPPPEAVPHPEPVDVWRSPDGRFRSVVRPWSDGHPPTVSVLALDSRRRHWRPATGEEWWENHCMLVRWLYQQQRAE